MFQVVFQFDNNIVEGEIAQKTLDINTNALFIKLIVENMDSFNSVKDIRLLIGFIG
ncbi:MAG: hypothetical protein ACYST2_02020 [Planctomycetota bacterium]